MKNIKIIFLGVLCAALLLPILSFNFQEDYVSPIDNRMLTEWDKNAENVMRMADDYVKDRIGFRTEAIDAYTELNDKLFGMMIHPTYMYGKEGHVFLRMSEEVLDDYYVELFCSYLRKVQDYCEERGVPFIYCLNPSKITIYEQYLPKGYHYTNKVNTVMYENLQKYGINYITNEEILREKSEREEVYNRKYDVGHWNDLGAFYGSNHILEKLSEDFPEVHPRELSEFQIEEVLETSLPSSHFEISEKVPEFVDKNQDKIQEITEEYKGLWLDYNYNELHCRVNRADGADKLPKVLVFQGSYYNSRLQYFQSAFQEYDAVHNYQNFLNFDYYFNVFQPDCVILENAEYTLNDEYFSYSLLDWKELNPKLDIEAHRNDLINLKDMEYRVSEEGRLCTVSVENLENITKGWLVVGDRQFDFIINSETQAGDCAIDKKYFQEEDMKVFFE